MTADYEVGTCPLCGARLHIFVLAGRTFYACQSKSKGDERPCWGRRIETALGREKRTT